MKLLIYLKGILFWNNSGYFCSDAKIKSDVNKASLLILYKPTYWHTVIHTIS